MKDIKSFPEILFQMIINIIISITILIVFNNEGIINNGIIQLALIGLLVMWLFNPLNKYIKEYNLINNSQTHNKENQNE